FTSPKGSTTRLSWAMRIYPRTGCRILFAGRAPLFVRPGPPNLADEFVILPRCSPCPGAQVLTRLQRRPDAPRRELLLADAVQLALRLLPRCHRENLLEDLFTHDLNRRALQNDAGVYVHVGFHMRVHRRVGGDLDRRGGFAAEHRAAAGGEDKHVGAAGDDAGHAHRIVTGCVHDDKAFCFDRLGVVNDVHHGGATALGDGAEGLLVDRREAAVLVAGRGVVVDLGAEDARVPFPPLDALDKLFADGPADRAAREEVLGPVNLRRFADDAGAALGDEQIAGDAEGGVGSDAAVAVRAAAVRAEHD